MSKKKRRDQKLETVFMEDAIPIVYASDIFKDCSGAVSSAALADFKIPEVPDNDDCLKGDWLQHDKCVVCHYARFHQPVPPYVNKEPVSEFKVKSDSDKYKVDSIVYTPHGVIWTANGETNIVPLANVIYVRTIDTAAK